MILNDIYLIRKEGMFCDEMALASVAAWFGRKYELIFSNVWKFDYKSDSDSRILIGDRLIPGEWYLKETFEEYTGIKTNFVKISSLEELLKLIKYELNAKRPILGLCECRYLPWMPEHDKTDSTILIIIGMSDDGQHVFVYDTHLSYMNKKVQCLPVHSLLKGCNFYSVFVAAQNKSKDFDYRNVITEILNNVNLKSQGLNSFDKIRLFANQFYDSMDFQEEIKGKSMPLETPLINNIETIERSRILFSMFLNFVGKSVNNNRITEISYCFENSKWKAVKAILIKMFYKGEMNKDRRLQISDILLKISKIEESASNDLMAAVTDPYALTNLNVIHKQVRNTRTQKNIVNIDISNLYNNNGFTKSISNDFCADLTGVKECFFTEGIDEIYKTLNIRNLFFPKIVEDKANNISCSCQEISLQKKWYTNITLIACAELQDIVDSLTIVYNNGQSTDLEVSISNWWNDAPLFGDEIVWSGNVLLGQIPETRIADKKYNIYAKTFDLPYEGYIDKIILPLRPNLHIFSICMEAIDANELELK